jgi:hypothetical protein
MNISTTVLDKKNKLVLVNKDERFYIVSYTKAIFFFIKSRLTLNFNTDLMGDKIVESSYQFYNTQAEAERYIQIVKKNFLHEKRTGKSIYSGGGSNAGGSSYVAPRQVEEQADDSEEALKWWNSLSEEKKWVLTINHLKHWEDFNEDEILRLWFDCGYGA